MTYCIYTDRDVANEDGNLDHVFPLSLGGDNQFTIWSDRNYNSDVGSSVDGALANDLLVMFARRNTDSRGHSNVPPIPKFKRSTIRNRHAQISFKREELLIWDSIDKRYLTEEEKIGMELTSTLTIDAFAPIRFLAKVVLGGGYFIYGAELSNYADCEVLRHLITLNLHTVNSVLNSASHVRVCDRYDENSYTAGNEENVRRQVIEWVGRSILISEFSSNAVAFHVGVLGMFIGSIVFFRDGVKPPDDVEEAIGHGVLLGPGDFQRITFRELLGLYWADNFVGELPRP